VMLHSFTESQKLVKEAVNENFFVGVGYNITNDQNTFKVIQNTPIENILTETDCPIKYNNKKIFPTHINEINQKIAQIKNIEIDEIQKQVEKNYKKLFFGKK
jgi:TatD DNase family protein